MADSDRPRLDRDLKAFIAGVADVKRRVLARSERLADEALRDLALEVVLAYDYLSELAEKILLHVGENEYVARPAPPPAATPAPAAADSTAPKPATKSNGRPAKDHSKPSPEG